MSHAVNDSPHPTTGHYTYRRHDNDGHAPRWSAFRIDFGRCARFSIIPLQARVVEGSSKRM